MGALLGRGDPAVIHGGLGQTGGGYLNSVLTAACVSHYNYVELSGGSIFGADVVRAQLAHAPLLLEHACAQVA